MADSLKKRLDKQYDTLRAQLKAGKITAAELKKQARIMHEHYKANRPKNGGRSTTPTPTPTPTRQTAPAPTPTPTSPRRPDGTSGAPMPSNPPGQRQTRTGGAKPPSTDHPIMSSSSVYTGNRLNGGKTEPKRPGRGSRYSGGVRNNKNNNKPPSRTGPNRTQRRNRGR